MNLRFNYVVIRRNRYSGPTDRDAEDTTVREIFDELAAQRDIAYTTVMSTMDNLHRKGWLARERSGKAYKYWPTLTREEHSARLMLEALGSGGRSDLVLSHFVDRITAEESAGLRAALRRLTARKTPDAPPGAEGAAP